MVNGLCSSVQGSLETSADVAGATDVATAIVGAGYGALLSGVVAAFPSPRWRRFAQPLGRIDVCVRVPRLGDDRQCSIRGYVEDRGSGSKIVGRRLARCMPTSTHSSRINVRAYPIDQSILARRKDRSCSFCAVVGANLDAFPLCRKMTACFAA